MVVVGSVANAFGILVSDRIKRCINDVSIQPTNYTVTTVNLSVQKRLSLLLSPSGCQCNGVLDLPSSLFTGMDEPLSIIPDGYFRFRSSGPHSRKQHK